MAVPLATRMQLDQAVEAVRHASPDRRRTGLRRLFLLADRDAALRAPLAVVVGAYLRNHPGPGQDGVDPDELAVRVEVLDLLRARLTDPERPTSWCGLDVDLRDCVLAGDLSGITVAGGAVRLDRAVVPAGCSLDLRCVRVTDGVLSLDRATVAGRLDATGLAVSGGEVSLGQLVVDGGTVLLDGARVTDAAVLAPGLVVRDGLLSLRGLALDRGRLSLHGVQLLGGTVRLDAARVRAGALQLSGATVVRGQLRVDQVALEDGTLSLTLADVRGGRLSLAGGDVGNGLVHVDGLAVGRGARVDWGPVPPVDLPEPAEPAERTEIDLRGPEPVDRWAWLGLPTPEPARRHDLPSPRERTPS